MPDWRRLSKGVDMMEIHLTHDSADQRCPNETTHGIIPDACQSRGKNDADENGKWN
jgi:hypothetical protein